MNNSRFCSDQCRWYGTCENAGNGVCAGLSVPEDEESDEREDMIERMTY